MSGEDGPSFRPIAPLLDIVAEANWGRWEEDDELGAINELGSEEMQAGLAAAYGCGETAVERYSLQTPMTGHGIDALLEEAEFPTTDAGDPYFPSLSIARRDNVVDAVHNSQPTPSGGRFAEDHFVTPVSLHGTTHFDALAHGWYDESLYNGFDPETTHTRRRYDTAVDGCEGKPVQETVGIGRADISNAAAAGVAGRAVLLDVGRYTVDEPPYRLDMGTPVTLEDLLHTAEDQGVEILDRDILLVRTGSIECARDPDEPWHALDDPGLTYSDELVRWVRDRDIPIIGADNLGIEQFVHEVDDDDLDSDRTELAGDYLIPLHGAFLRDLGVTLNEMLDLSALAMQAAADGTYDMLFTAGPLHVEMGTAAPVNPIVLKAIGSG